MEDRYFSDREGLLADFEKPSSRASSESNEVHSDTDSSLSPRGPMLYRKLSLLYMIFVHIGLILTLGFLLRSHTSTADCSPFASFSPAHEAITPELGKHTKTAHSHTGVYSGKPNAENNEAWDTLVLPMYSALTEADLRAAGETIEGSVQLESGEYVATITAYHLLHCIRQLRMYLYKDAYYPNMTLPQDEYLRGHMDHCLDALREEAMCFADTSVITFFWHDPPRQKPGIKSNAKKNCVNWDRLAEWSMEHRIPPNAAVRGGISPLWGKETTEH